MLHRDHAPRGEALAVADPVDRVEHGDARIAGAQEVRVQRVRDASARPCGRPRPAPAPRPVRRTAARAARARCGRERCSARSPRGRGARAVPPCVSPIARLHSTRARAATLRRRVEINGMAHVILTVARLRGGARVLRRAAAVPGPHAGRRLPPSTTTASAGGPRSGIRPGDPARAGRGVQPGAQRPAPPVLPRALARGRRRGSRLPGRARRARSCTRRKRSGLAPGYYSVLFEDRDGIRLEVNHVPGRGLLEPGVRRPGR